MVFSCRRGNDIEVFFQILFRVIEILMMVMVKLNHMMTLIIKIKLILVIKNKKNNKEIDLNQY
jgi:hypothetical protein